MPRLLRISYWCAVVPLALGTAIFVLWLLVIGMWLSVIPTAFAQDQGLAKIDDLRLVQILNNAEIIARYDTPPVAVRIYRVQEQGECSPGKPATCPLQHLLVAVSGYGEYPEQQLFMSPQAQGWVFLGWTHLPGATGREQVVTFKLKRQRPSLIPKEGWWVDTYYEMGVQSVAGLSQRDSRPRQAGFKRVSVV